MLRGKTSTTLRGKNIFVTVIETHNNLYLNLPVGENI